MSGKRYYGGEMVTKGGSEYRIKKVQRYRKKGKVGLRGLMIKTKPELKEFQYTPGLNQIQQYGQLYIVNQVPQGTNYNQRVGNHIRAKYIRVQWICWVPTTTNTYDDVRMMVVWDTQPNGGASAVVYGFPSTANTILDSFAAPIIAYKNTGLAGDRFLILRDEKMTVQSTTPAVTTSNNNQFDTRRYGECYIDLRGQDMEFNTTTGGIPTTGALYVCWVSANNQIPSTNNAQFVFNSKLVYTDV